MTVLDRLDALAGTVSQAIPCLAPREWEDHCEPHMALRELVAAVRERDELRENFTNAAGAVAYAVDRLPPSGSKMTQAAERRMREAVYLMDAALIQPPFCAVCNMPEGGWPARAAAPPVEPPSFPPVGMRPESRCPRCFGGYFRCEDPWHDQGVPPSPDREAGLREALDKLFDALVEDVSLSEADPADVIDSHRPTFRAVLLASDKPGLDVDMSEGETMRLDGPVILIQSDTDPGDMGEPREFWDDDAKATCIVVPSFDLWWTNARSLRPRLNGGTDD